MATTFSKLLLTIVEITIAQVTFAQAAIVKVTSVQNRHKGIESGSWEERTWTEAHFEAHFYRIQVEERTDNTIILWSQTWTSQLSSWLQAGNLYEFNFSLLRHCESPNWRI